MSACCTLVDILAIFAISSETCFANALEGAIGVHTPSSVIWTIMLSTITFVYIITWTPVAFKAIVTLAAEALFCVDTGSPRFVAVVRALLAFISELTWFNSISVISLFTPAFVSTWYVNTMTVPMTTSIFVLWKIRGKNSSCYLLRVLVKNNSHLICRQLFFFFSLCP